MKIFITGRPGIGKTTVFMRVLEMLRREDIEVTGFYCPEVRESGVRIGFKIVDIGSGESGWLAISRDRYRGLCTQRVGRYCVVREDAERIALRVLDKIDTARVFGVDEIGPMELMIESLKNVIERILSLDKPGFYVVHERIVEDLARRYSDTEIYRLNEINRSSAPKEIFFRLTRYMSRER
ncbi:MAG: NTPase [Sulfolobales archaeon]